MKNNIKSLLKICRMIHKVQPYLLFHGILISLFQIINIYLPLIFASLLINSFTQSKSLQYLIYIILIMASLIFLCNILEHFETRNINIAKQAFEQRLRCNITRKTMYIKYEKLEDKETLNLIEKARIGIDQSGGIGNFVLNLCNLIRLIFTIMISATLLCQLLFYKSPIVLNGLLKFFDSPFIGILLFLLFILYVKFGRIISNKFEKEAKIFFEQNANLSREAKYYSDEVALNYTMGKDIRLFHMQEAVLEEMNHRQKRSLKFYSNFIYRIAIMFSSLLFLGNIINGLLYIFTAIKVIMQAIQIGSFVTYAGAISKLNQSIIDFPIIYTDVIMMAEYMEYYLNFLQLEEEEISSVEIDESAEIIFDHVSYIYPGTKVPVVDDVSITLKPHKKYALVGMNGAGKTTFVKLLCGLYKPSSGRILIDEKPIVEKEYVLLRNNFSVVFQDFSLFPGTLGQNIIGTDKMNKQAVLDTLKRSGLSQKVDTLPNGINTPLFIQEGGVELSGGEMQKVAISRALYQNRNWFILDEPTAALDPISEMDIYTHLNDMIENSSTLYISHRMSSCKFCDEIIVFNKGKIAQKGSHEKLKNTKGIYQDLWNAQATYYK